MTRNALTAVGACCLLGLIAAGAGVYALFAAFHRAQVEISPGTRIAVAFATAVGQGDDDRAYAMLSGTAQHQCPIKQFRVRAAEARKDIGKFQAEQPGIGANVDLRIHNGVWRYSTTLPLRGDQARGIASVDMIRTGPGRWQVDNWAVARADAG